MLKLQVPLLEVRSKIRDLITANVGTYTATMCFLDLKDEYPSLQYRVFHSILLDMVMDGTLRHFKLNG